MGLARLPFELYGRLADQRSVIVTAHANGGPVTSEKFQLGNGKRRREIAELWSADSRLTKGDAFSANDLLYELDRLEQEAFEALRQQESEASTAGDVIEVASYVDEAVFVDLAWNQKKAKPNFLVFFRADQNTERMDRYQPEGVVLVPPQNMDRIITPGGDIEGAVLVPTLADFDWQRDLDLRREVRAFIDRYVELPGETATVAVEYIFRLRFSHRVGHLFAHSVALSESVPQSPPLSSIRLCWSSPSAGVSSAPATVPGEPTPSTQSTFSAFSGLKR